MVWKEAKQIIKVVKEGVTPNTREVKIAGKGSPFDDFEFEQIRSKNERDLNKEKRCQ